MDFHDILFNAGVHIANQLLKEAREKLPLTLSVYHELPPDAQEDIARMRRFFNADEKIVEGSLVEPITDPAHLLEV